MGLFSAIKEAKRKKQVKVQKKRGEVLNSVMQMFLEQFTEKGELPEFIEKFRDHSLIMLVIGARGSGKTALGMRFLEAGKRFKKKTYAIGFSSSKTPSWIKKTDSIEDVPNNSLVLVDEAGITLSARDSVSKHNKEIGKILAIARHKGLTLIFITQNSAMIDLNVLRLCDVLLFKQPSLLQSRFERKSLQDMFQKVGEQFKGVKEKRKHFYVLSDDFEGLVSTDLPGFWNESISKSFKKS